jgi:hypothetical protein
MLWYMRRFLRAAQRKREDIDKFLSHTQRLVLEVAHPYASTGLIILACRQREEVLLYKTLRPLARDFGVHYVGQFLSSNVTDELDFEERDWLWSVLNNLGKRENNDETDDSLGGQAA